jgi:(p)ppGpp synthase/HD superfamily hydrolase
VTPEGARIGPDEERDDDRVLEDLHVPAGSRFRDALQFAAMVHADHKRKGSALPYISHLIAVASLVMENGGSEDVAIAALLHDALEDQPEAVTAPSLERLFGTDVRRIVEACSDGLSEDGRRREAMSWKERKKAYIEHLEEADRKVDELLVALADKVHNARSILRDLRETSDERAFWRRFNAKKADQFWYYGTLAKVFERRFPGPLATELTQLVTAIRLEDKQCAERRKAGAKA